LSLSKPPFFFGEPFSPFSKIGAEPAHRLSLGFSLVNFVCD
jgi:hypothetical protein